MVEDPGDGGGEVGDLGVAALGTTFVVAPVDEHRALADRSMPSRAAASISRPGRGLRQAQPSASSWGHTSTSSTGTTDRRLRLISSTLDRDAVPRAMSGWLVTTMVRKPASRSRSTAAATPGSTSRSSTRAGG